MADNTNISTWQAFCEFIEDYAKNDPDFIFISLRDKLGGFDFPNLPPEKLIHCATNDPNAILNAAGLALDGRKPWISGSSSTLVSRSYGQIREALAIPNLPVRIAVYDGGLSMGRDGASRLITEDIAVMRSMPNMGVMIPSDSFTLAYTVERALKCSGPVYLRLGQTPVPLLTADNEQNYRQAGARILREGSGVTIVTCGIMGHEALKASVILEQQGISAEVLECCSVKPLPEQALLASVRSTGCCVVAEEHSRIGGLCSAVAECLSETYPVPVKFVAIEDQFVHSGTPAELREYYGLTWKEIVNAASQAWALRRR
ncbi:transketolase [Synergistaceae bacterium OttesenSCG-928-D05]|nr:transketolase [Synergistaceae bacterium OttesenSCG-928-D05]